MVNYSYLALGDSYTIGEQVDFADNFPNQTVQLLRKSGFAFFAAEIIAKTGWTTDELSEAVDKILFLEQYDIVTLLIGVNNQYRNRSADQFNIEFEQLLRKAIQFSGNRPNRVVVLSIPDWGVTPFAAERNSVQIAAEIDAFNDICQKQAESYEVNFINITHSQREDAAKPDFLAPDTLHPSRKEYEKWAHELSSVILKVL